MAGAQPADDAMPSALLGGAGEDAGETVGAAMVRAKAVTWQLITLSLSVQRVSAEMNPPGIPAIPNQIPESRSWIVQGLFCPDFPRKRPVDNPRIGDPESDSWDSARVMSAETRCNRGVSYVAPSTFFRGGG